MKKLVPLLSLSLALAAFASFPARSAAADTAKMRVLADNSSAFTITWTRSTPMELAEAVNQAKFLEREVQNGNVPPEHLNSLRNRIEHLARRAPPLINLNSKGGPLSGFVAATAKLDKIAFTLINAAEPADLDTPIAPFELSNASWDTVINVLSTFLLSRGLQLRVVGGDHPNPAEASTVVCVLHRTDSAREAAQRATERNFESLQLGEHIFGAQTIEVIVDAIREAWELDPTRDPKALRLRFHPATKLLLVSGPSPASHVVRQVIGGLQKKPAQP